MKNENFYVVHGWMINNLKLKGNKLLVFSIIYGFSQDGQTKYTGGLKYLVDATGSSKSTVRRSLDELVQEEFLHRHTEVINSITFNNYSKNDRGVSKWNGGVVKMTLGV